MVSEFQGLVEAVINDEGDVLIVDDSNLYVVHPAYFVKNNKALYVDMDMAQPTWGGATIKCPAD